MLFLFLMTNINEWSALKTISGRTSSDKLTATIPLEIEIDEINWNCSLSPVHKYNVKQFQTKKSSNNTLINDYYAVYERIKDKTKKN